MRKDLQEQLLRWGAKKGPISSDDTADRSFYYVGGMDYSSSPEYSLFDLFRDEIFF